MATGCRVGRVAVTTWLTGAAAGFATAWWTDRVATSFALTTRGVNGAAWMCAGAGRRRQLSHWRHPATHAQPVDDQPPGHDREPGHQVVLGGERRLVLEGAQQRLLHDLLGLVAVLEPASGVAGEPWGGHPQRRV